MNVHLPTLERPPAERSGETTIAPDLQPDLPGMIDSVSENPVDEPEDRREFDWFTEDCIVLREQLSTAVYRNRLDAVVIRQEGNGYDPADQFIVLRDADAVKTLIAALKRELERGPQ